MSYHMMSVIWHNMMIVMECQPEAGMPWKKEHKSETRGRILEKAAAAIRERGVAGVGVAQMMEAAGLTHGGFYAHFPSKDALVADAFAYACEQSAGVLEKIAAEAAPNERLRAVAGAYLTAGHARHPERGCPISAVGPDLVRGEGPGREACADAVRRRLEWLEDLAPGKTREERRRLAAGTYATMLGALFVARALGGAEGEKYLAQVRRFLRHSQESAHP
jgi:TetR/AcrR family transcriptional regulator, transcriptional repressor for nem operon